jgi:gluconate 5-dehydrogenase
MNRFDLKNKKVLITGSSGGLGYTMAHGLAKEGATVILNGRNKDKLHKAIQLLKQKSLQVDGYVFDVTDKNQVKESILMITEKYGSIDVLVNNAGIQIRGPLEDFEENDWDLIIKTNLSSAFIVGKHVVRGMIERRSGKIINICSLQSDLARPTIAPYSASKGGLKMLTRAMATEWAKHNIQVNAIGPGYFKTEMTKALYENKEFDAWLCSRTPANRWGNPEELLGSLIFLASEASSYVNGQIIYIDGGMTACV